ncbi:MAG: hypothetical protein AB7E60_07815 [Sphingobium sp.]
MKGMWRARVDVAAERRAERLRAAIARSLRLAGVAHVVVEGEAIRASGRGLWRRWMNEPALREAGRGEI